ncbi:hypothetical protein AB0L59_29550 [Streptomyces sp. NPDC052109]|uniref:hypothetical protein n=1 Tax=Streptomyces sp. NPDC052109 TaxID=3155527 RepID=UPI003422F4EA
MAAYQLPRGVREFASYLNGLLARLDRGGGWSGVFWQRDPDGMRACLDGREVPPWDVVEALLEDLAAAYGPAAAASERERARALYRAAHTAYDARPGARDALLDRLDVMLREQRHAAGRRAELIRLLSLPSSAEGADSLRLDLAWAEDDHDRATARCTELRARLAELDRRGAVDAGAVRSGGEPAGEEAAQRAAPAGAPVAFRDADGQGGWAAGEWRRVGRTGGEAGLPWAGEGGGAEAAGRSAPAGLPPRSTDAPRASTSAPAPPAARPARISPVHRPDASASAPAGAPLAPGVAVSTPPGVRPIHTPPAPTFHVPTPHAPAPDVPTPHASAPDAPAQGPEAASPAPGVAVPARQAAPPAPEATALAPQAVPPSPRTRATTVPHPFPGTTGPEPPGAPAKSRKRRRGSARFAGMVGEDAAAAVVLPQASPPVVPEAPTRRTPRGARFAGVGEAPAPAAGPVEVVDAGAEAAVAGAVERLARLRREGRSGEAHVLLVEAVQWPAGRFPALADALYHAGLGADWATLLWEAASLPPERLVEVAAALTAAGRADDGQQLLRQGVGRPAEQIGAAVLRLEGEGRREEAAALLDACVRVRTANEAARSVAPDPRRLVPLLLRAAQAVSAERHWDLVHALRVAGHTA